MKARVQTRLADRSTKSDLSQMAPVATPMVLMVDPSSACNFQCTFCPTGDRQLIKSIGRYQGPKSLDAFKKIIDDLREFDSPIRVLRLYKEGEPLMNKYLPEMIQYARESGRVERIDTTTNGALLNPKISDRLIASGIDQINISVNGVQDSHFTQLVKTKVNFEKYVENVRYLYENRGKCEIYVKAIKENLSEDDQKKFMDTFGNISDRIFLENMFSAWPDFKSDVIPAIPAAGHYGQEVIERTVCPFPFYMMVINSDGSVSLCVADWARTAKIGSITENSLKEIWLGERLNSYRLMHLNGCRKGDVTCANCEVITHGVFENIDASAQQIKERLLAAEYR